MALTSGTAAERPLIYDALVIGRVSTRQTAGLGNGILLLLPLRTLP